MMEYKRFTKRLENGGIEYLDRNEYYHTFYGNGASDPIHALVAKLCELEDKLENRTLIELPCKVGDTVYLPWLYAETCAIAYLTVTHIILDTEKSYIKTNFETDNEDYYEKYKGGQYDFNDFGKIVFTNKAEAEKKLKELQE